MKVYLGGPITGLTFDEARSWRLYAAAQLEEYGVTSLDPLRGKEQLGLTDTPLTAWFDGGLDAVARDLEDIDTSDIVLLNFQGMERASIGSCAEMGYAFQRGQRGYGAVVPEIVAVVDTDVYDHVFVSYMADKTFDTLRGALDYIISRRPIADPEGGRGIHGVELQDGAEGYRGWLTGGDQTPGPVADQSVRPAEVVGGGGHRIEIARETHDPTKARIGW